MSELFQFTIPAAALEHSSDSDVCFQVRRHAEKTVSHVTIDGRAWQVICKRLDLSQGRAVCIVKPDYGTFGIVQNNEILFMSICQIS